MKGSLLRNGKVDKTDKYPYCGNIFVEPNIMVVYADNRVFMSFEVLNADERINEYYNVGPEL